MLPKTAVLNLLRWLGIESHIARNAIVMGSAEICVRVLNFAISVLLFRYLDPQEMGALRFVFSAGILFAIIGDGGISRPAVRLITRVPREQLGEWVQALTAARILLNLIMVGLLWFALRSPLSHQLDQTTRLLLAVWSVAVVFQNFRKNAEVVFQAHQEIQYHAFFLLLNRTIALIAQLYLVWRKSDIWGIVAGFIIADAVDLAGSHLFLLYRYGRLRCLPSLKRIRHLFVEGVPFTLNLICQQLRYYLDPVLLKYLFRGTASTVDTQIGLYSSALTFVTTFLFLPNSLLAAVFPELARTYVQDRRRYRSLACDTLNLLFLVGGGLAVTVFFLRQELLPLLYGQKYSDAVPMLGGAVWAIPLVFLATGLSAIFAAGNRQSFATGASWIATASKLVLCYMFLPHYGGLGASYVMVGTEGLLVGILLVELFRWERQVLNLRTLLPATLLHGGAVMILSSAGLPMRAKLVLVVVYALLVAMGAYRIYRRRRLRS